MSYITELEKEADLSIAMTTFSATCAANAAALSLNPAALTELAGMAANYAASLTAYATSRAATNLAQENKQAQRRASKAILSKWAKTFRANPAIPDALLDQLTLPHHKTPPTKTPPVTPLDLVANANVQGLVSLKWKRSSNREGTVFTIQTQTVLDGPWSIAGSTTKTKFDYQAVLGSYIGFRVFASRDGADSEATIPVTLWANGGGNSSLSIAA